MGVDADGYKIMTPEEKAEQARVESQGGYFGDRSQLMTYRGWRAADLGMMKRGYRDPRVAGYDPYVKQGMPAWADKERRELMQRTQADRTRQAGARDLLSAQSKEETVAGRAGAYKLGNVQQGAAGAIGASADPAAQRAAMLGFGKSGQAISGQTMGKGADERTRAIAVASQAADKSLKGYTVAAGEGAQYQALALQDKWNRQRALLDFEKMNLQTELAKAKARGAMTAQEMNMILGLAGAGGSVIESGVAAGGSGGSSGSGGSGGGSGSVNIDDIVSDVFS